MSAWLDFEKPVVELEEKIQELKTQVRDRGAGARDELADLERRAESLRREVYANLTPYQRVQLARHPRRPFALDYIERCCTGWTELHGDRHFGDDPAIVAGLALLDQRPVLVIGQQKGRDTKENLLRRFGMPNPEGYRKALRAMRLAEKFRRPVICLVDTPAAYPGMESEERGIAEAIAVNLREMAVLDTSILVVVTGEGGSGGALGIAVGDTVLMQEFAVYSVIPPEGCAAILWRDAAKKVEAAEALKMTAPDLLARGIVDGIIPEPDGGAHHDPDLAAERLDDALWPALQRLIAMPASERLDRRYEKFRRIGGLGAEISGTTA